jgi:hypothetical protein
MLDYNTLSSVPVICAYILIGAILLQKLWHAKGLFGKPSQGLELPTTAKSRVPSLEHTIAVARGGKSLFSTFK